MPADGAPFAPPPRAKREPRGPPIEVVARHAIHGSEVTVRVPAHAKFKHVKKALAKRLGSDEILTRGRLMKKEGGTYVAHKDNTRVHDARQVLVACADFGRQDASVEAELTDGEITEEEEEVAPKGGSGANRTPAAAEGQGRSARAPPGSLSRDQVVKLQLDLFHGFRAEKFQKQLQALEGQRAAGALPVTEFLHKRQELFLTVQAAILPDYGFEGSADGVYRMMAAMGPYVKDRQFVELANGINRLLRVDSPPESWATLSEACEKLEAPPEPVPIPKPTTVLLSDSKADHGPPTVRTGPGMPIGTGRPGDASSLARPRPRFLGSHAVRLERAATPERAPAESAVASCSSSSVSAAPEPAPHVAQPQAAKEEHLDPEELSFDPWPTGRPKPFALHVAGSWSGYRPQEMSWKDQASIFVLPVALGPSATEDFHLLVNGNAEKLVYPSLDESSIYQDHVICGPGPDAECQGRRWRIGKYADDEAEPGKRYCVVAAVDASAKVALVGWQALAGRAL